MFGCTLMSTHLAAARMCQGTCRNAQRMLHSQVLQPRDARCGAPLQATRTRLASSAPGPPLQLFPPSPRLALPPPLLPPSTAQTQ